MATINDKLASSEMLIKDFLDKEAFLKEAQKELDRIKRYGHRATFLLINPHIKKNKTTKDYKKFLYNLINNELRSCDSVYLFSDAMFSVILPDTHEGGGESAALRLKRKISQFCDDAGEKVASDVGVVSIGPENIPTLDGLIKELEKDLKRDQRCHLIQTCEKAINNKRIIIIGFQDQLFDVIKARFGYLYEVTNRWPSDLEILNNVEILVIKEKLLNRSHDYIKKLQKNSGLQFKFEVKLNVSSDLQESIVFFTKEPFQLSHVTLDILALFVKTGQRLGSDEKKKYKDVLSNIGSFTHQMNQPLQIIMGKVELLLLDLDLQGHKDLPDDFKETLRQIKEQVHYAAEVNQKINRLTKI